MSQGSARIDAVEGLDVGDQVAPTFKGMKAIAGESMRGGEQFGVYFTPVWLLLEELRDLVTTREQARKLFF